jgi:hypothetical protein
MNTMPNTIPAFRLERDCMIALADAHANEFQTNTPFPHVVIPNFLPADVARMLADEFPNPGQIPWTVAGPGHVRHSNDPNIEKLEAHDETVFPDFIRHVMHEFNSGTFMMFLERLTGYKMLSPDPTFSGCGLHSTGRGGRLMVHADASRHPNPKLQQILNMIYYVTPDWQEEWGGQLELWERDMSKCSKRVVPTFNSALIFFTGVKSFHGHPHPLTTPPGVRRNSLAAYYYTTERQSGVDFDGHRAYVDWQRTTSYDRSVTGSQRVKYAAKKYLPRPVVRALRSFVARR